MSDKSNINSSDGSAPNALTSSVDGFRIQELERRVSEFESKIERDKTSLLTVFGIFSSIVTFLSVQVQILQQARSIATLSFLSLLLLFGLLCFLFLLQYLARTWLEKDENRAFLVMKWTLASLAVMTVLTGIIALSEQDSGFNVWDKTQYKSQEHPMNFR